MVFEWFCVFFFFRQETAYDMRMSDWSSDVCSSDLPRVRRGRWWLALVFVAALAFGAWGAWKTFAPADATARPRDQRAWVEALEQQVATLKRSDQISRHRKSVV